MAIVCKYDNERVRAHATHTSAVGKWALEIDCFVASITQLIPSIHESSAPRPRAVGERPLVIFKLAAQRPGVQSAPAEMTLRLVFVGATLLGCVWAKSLGDAGAPGGLETLVGGLVRKESRELGETILKLIDDRAGTLQKVVRRVSDDKELRGLVQKAVEGLNAVIRVAGVGDVDDGAELKAESDIVRDNSTGTAKELTEDDEGTVLNLICC